MRPVAAHSIAIAAAFLAIVVATAAWIANLRAGPKLGLEAGAMVIMVPLALLVLTAIWLVVRSMLGARQRWGAIGATAICAVLAYAIVALTCGPVACFQAGPNRAMGWFLVGGVALAALVHHVLLGRLVKSPRNPD
jgi:hypothetical protein